MKHKQPIAESYLYVSCTRHKVLPNDDAYNYVITTQTENFLPRKSAKSRTDIKDDQAYICIWIIPYYINSLSIIGYIVKYIKYMHYISFMYTEIKGNQDEHSLFTIFSLMRALKEVSLMPRVRYNLSQHYHGNKKFFY